MLKIDIARAPRQNGSAYPAPFNQPCEASQRAQLGVAAGLSDFGVNLLHLPPGAWSAQRHWHDAEDEFVYVLSGEVVLVTDAGETLLKSGDCAGFPKKRADGHHLVNRSSKTAEVLEVGTRTETDVTTYPDIDLRYSIGLGGYLNQSGQAYPKRDT